MMIIYVYVNKVIQKIMEIKVVFVKNIFNNKIIYVTKLNNIYNN